MEKAILLNFVTFLLYFVNKCRDKSGSGNSSSSSCIRIGSTSCSCHFPCALKKRGRWFDKCIPCNVPKCPWSHHVVNEAIPLQKQLVLCHYVRAVDSLIYLGEVVCDWMTRTKDITGKCWEKNRLDTENKNTRKELEIFEK